MLKMSTRSARWRPPLLPGPRVTEETHDLAELEALGEVMGRAAPERDREAREVAALARLLFHSPQIHPTEALQRRLATLRSLAGSTINLAKLLRPLEQPGAAAAAGTGSGTIRRIAAGVRLPRSR